MLHLLWGIANLVLLLFFISTCFKATKLVKEKLGLFAAVVFVFGLLSFAANSNQSKENNQRNEKGLKNGGFVPEDSVAQGSKKVIILVLDQALICVLRGSSCTS